MDSVINPKRVDFSNTGGGGQASGTVWSVEEDNNSVHNLGQATTGIELAITSVAVAAAAYAVHSLDSANNSFISGKTTTNDRRQKGDDHLVSFPRSKTRTKEIEAAKTRQGSMRKPSFEAPLAHKPSKIPSSSLRSKINTEAKIDTWERNEVEKIKKRYANIRSRIHSWEDDKKTKAKIKLQRKKIELECSKERNHHHYQFQIQQINQTGANARAEMEKKMTREEIAVKERAKKIRSGQRAKYFICF